MAYYNLTELGQAENIAKLGIYANNVTDQLFFGFVILAIFFIMLIILKRWEFEKALISSSFSCFILSAILTYGGFLNFMFALVFLIIMAFTGFYMYVNNRL